MNGQMRARVLETLHKGVFIKSEVTKFYLSALLLSMCLIVPARAADLTTVEIKPPKTSVHVDLGPYDAKISFINTWYCKKSFGLEKVRKDVEKLWADIKQNKGHEWPLVNLRTSAKSFLMGEKVYSAEQYWGNWHILQPPPYVVDPPQGTARSHTWEHCYTREELESAKREAIRWAHYILDIYLPKNFPDVK